MASESDAGFMEMLRECSPEYLSAIKLMCHDSKLDPVSAPYQSHYKSREILNGLIEKLKAFEESSFQNVDCKRAKAVIHLKLGVNYVETEETSSGEEHFKQCQDIIDDCETNFEKNTGINQELLNQLGLFYSQRNNLEKGLEYLLEAKVLYQKFVKEVGGCPWTVENFFEIGAYGNEPNEEMIKKRIEIFEDNLTHTLYYLAQVYGKLEKNFESAEYCKETLKRQLSRNKYEPFDWSMNAATLSQFYITNNEYSTARHCLASAELILKEFGERPTDLLVDVSKDESQETVNFKEKLPKAWADLFRCWAKYAISLLEYSRDRLFDKLENSSNNTNEQIQMNESEKEIFNLELASYENQITDKPVLVFDEARAVFLQGQTWINGAKEFCVIDGHCSDHVELTRDHSTMFKLLAFFELDFNRQCKMHKRRIDMLSDVLQKLNSQYYLAVCCQLSFEIGEIYSAMLDNKLAILELNTGCNKTEKEQAVKKINILAENSIEYFNMYIKYLKNREGKLPDKFQGDDERPVLIAHFYCGRMYSKLITPDRLEQLRNTKKSLECYSYLVEYCKRNPTATEKVQEEKAACEEMVRLLPAKMDKMKSQIDS